LNGDQSFAIAEAKLVEGKFAAAFWTVPGKLHRLEARDSLASEWASVGSVAGDGTFQVLTDANTGGSLRLYRVTVE